MKKKKFSPKVLILRASGIFAFLLLWEAASRFGWVMTAFMPPPTVVLQTIVDMALAGDLHPHAIASFARILRGLFFATLVGVSLGLIMGYFKTLNQVLDLLFQTFRQISAFALFPIFILFFGLSEVSKTIIIFWASLWPVLLNTAAGVRDTDPVLIRSAKSMGASKLYTFVNIIFPSSLPQIFTGIRLGGSYSVMAIVAAEMIGASSGLGFLILFSQQTFRVSQMYAGIISLAVLGILLNWILQSLEKFFSSWRIRDEA